MSERPLARAAQTGNNVTTGHTAYHPPGTISHLCSDKFQTCLQTL